MAWIALIVALIALLAVDLFLVRGRGGEMTAKTAALWSLAWVGISLVFAGVLLAFGTRTQVEGFLAGYLVEKSLSLDNVFVFLIVFQAFAVPVAQRARLLTYGIAGALVLRAIFIFAGAAALHSASWLAFPFAALLAWTGWRLWKGRHDHGGEEQLVERIRGRLPIAACPTEGRDHDGGGRLFVREDGRRLLSTGGAALAVIAVVDVIFGVDSVPAILAITTDTFVVFAANAFALLGLRPLFFFVADLVQRLYYLKAALAALLVFIAAKMVYGEAVAKLGPAYSLAGVFLILGTGVVASLVRRRRLATEQPAAA